MRSGLVALPSNQRQALHDIHLNGILNETFDLDSVLSQITRLAA